MTFATTTAATATASNPVFVPTNVEALLDPNLSDFAFRALCYLAFRSNIEKGGIAWPSIGRAADDLSKSYNSVLGGFQEAVAHGYADPVGKTPGGVVIYHVIRNGKISEVERSHPQISGDPLSRKLETPSPENWRQNKDSLTSTEEQQPPTPVQLAGRTDVVVVSLPAASQETASITPQPPQAAIPTKAPIDKPTQAIADTTRHGPTFGICNGETVQTTKQTVPARVEPPKAPPPKPEPIHPPAFHHSLTRSEAATILVLLAVLPPDLQAIVMAEFIIQLNGGNVRRPVGYVRKLIEVAQAGTFVPSASREAANRAEMEQNERTKAQEIVDQEEADRIRQADEATKLSAAMDAAGPERIAELRLEFIQHLKKTNKMAYGLYQADGFNSVGFEILFRGFLREKQGGPLDHSSHRLARLARMRCGMGCETKD